MIYLRLGVVYLILFFNLPKSIPISSFVNDSITNNFDVKFLKSDEEASNSSLRLKFHFELGERNDGKNISKKNH